MKRTKEDYPSFNLFPIVGTWESVNPESYGYHLPE